MIFALFGKGDDFLDWTMGIHAGVFKLDKSVIKMKNILLAFFAIHLCCLMAVVGYAGWNSSVQTCEEEFVLQPEHPPAL